MEKFPEQKRPQEVIGAMGIGEIEAAMRHMRRHKSIPHEAQVFYDWMAMVVDASNVNGGSFVDLRAVVM